MQVRNLLLCRTNFVQTRRIRRTHSSSAANDVLNDIRYSTIYHFHRFLSTRRNHSSIDSTILMCLLFFHASHFLVMMDWSSPQPSFCCLVDSLRLYTRGSVIPFLVTGKSLVDSYPSSSLTRHRLLLLLLQLSLQIILPTTINQLCLSRSIESYSALSLRLRHRYST